MNVCCCVTTVQAGSEPLVGPVAICTVTSNRQLVIVAAATACKLGIGTERHMQASNYPKPLYKADQHPPPFIKQINTHHPRSR
jgi:hypothetical protein